jgi:uncharacterized repeat protein (TIGR03803 family)
MKKLGLFEMVRMVLVFCAATAIASPAQILTTLYSFCSQPGCADGADPTPGLIQATDGNFYGTTDLGGGGNCSHGCGTVFKITPSGTLTTLHSFDDADGGYPLAGLMQATDGNFYGTTLEGGASSNCGSYGCGTVFKITPSGTLTTLHSFDSTDGANPEAGLVQATDGNFYGTTAAGGGSGNCAYGCGTVFKITPGGTLTTLHSFSGADGANPEAGLVQATDGNFYGTTLEGGAYGYGTVFKITPSGTLTTLHSFDFSDGSNPIAGLVQATDGNFYGTTLEGGAYDDCSGVSCGTVFKITASGTLTTLHSFDSTDGANPSAGLVQASDGNFYGTTENGGAYDGTVFKITPSGTLTTLHSFTGPDGYYPYAGLVQATDGNFYGTTEYGGAYNEGTVFRVVLPRPCIVCPAVE